MVLVAAAVVATACTEKLDSGRACPALCPIEQVGIVDTTIQGVILDTTLFAGPAIGAEPTILLLTRTDSALDLRGVFRFDSLPNNFVKKQATTTDTTHYPIVSVTGSRLLVTGDSTSANLPPLALDTVTVTAYDVDTSGVADTAVAPVAALFRPERIIGTRRLKPLAVRDTFNIPIADSVVLDKILGAKQLRIGLRIESGGNTAIRLISSNGGEAAVLRYRPSASADTAAADSLVAWPINSRTPVGDLTQRAQLADYTLIVKGTPPPPAGVIAAGGMRGRRIYMMLDVPKRLLDSTQIVRATLRLSQLRSPVATPADTGRLEVLLGTALASVTDLTKRSLFHEPVGYSLDSSYFGTVSGLRDVRMKSDTTATRSIEVAPILRRWANTDVSLQPHAIILTLPTEGTSPLELRFASLEAAPALRPSLQITFVPRNAPGIP